jgi:hypothetical protein
MARWHRMEHPKTAEIVWTDTPAAHGGWKTTATANRPPGDHEDKVDGRWKTDAAATERKARRAKLRAMHRDELVDHIVDEVIARLKVEGLVVKGSEP